MLAVLLCEIKEESVTWKKITKCRDSVSLLPPHPEVPGTEELSELIVPSQLSSEVHWLR